MASRGLLRRYPSYFFRLPFFFWAWTAVGCGRIGGPAPGHHHGPCCRLPSAAMRSISERRRRPRVAALLAAAVPQASLPFSQHGRKRSCAIHIIYILVRYNGDETDASCVQRRPCRRTVLLCSSCQRLERRALWACAHGVDIHQLPQEAHGPHGGIVRDQGEASAKQVRLS